MEHNRQNFLSFWTIFCPFTPRPTPHPPFNNPKNQNFEKMKKTPGDIIILHKCPINDDHMIVCHKWRSYVSWDINCNRQIFCHLGPFFALLPPPNSSKNENIKKTRKTEKKKMKKTSGNIIILCTCTENHDHMLYCSWDICVWQM